jgi:ureidoglycolate lyase
MRRLKIEALDAAEFHPFGWFVGMLNPRCEKIGKEPIEFFRDMLQQDLGGAAVVSYSVCRVCARPAVVDVTEYHNGPAEMMLPLDRDVFIHVGPATPEGTPPLKRFRVFRVPRGTMVVTRPGVWHHAPFTMDRKPANVLVALPERTYARDCHVVPLTPKQRLRVRA